MAMHESIKPQSCRVQVTNGVAAALPNRFCRAVVNGAVDDLMETHVPGAAGAPAQGVLAMRGGGGDQHDCIRRIGPQYALHFDNGAVADDAAEFLSVHEYTHVIRWTDAINERPAVQRGRMVNRVFGDLSHQLRERHDASDFDTKTQDKIEAAAAKA